MGTAKQTGTGRLTPEKALMSAIRGFIRMGATDEEIADATGIDRETAKRIMRIKF